MFPLSPPSTLLCSEDAGDLASPTHDNQIFVETTNSLCQPQDPISHLLASEHAFCPVEDYLSRLQNGSLDPSLRFNSILWILKVHAFYRFRPATACLAVNYLDRFLSSTHLPEENGAWPWQLLSIACLSVAAKMEETHVPLLLDLQVMDPSFVFEPRTVMRMEIFLMDALGWRMRSVTPFDFLDRFPGDLSGEHLSRATNVVLNSLSAEEFVGFAPSTISAAAIVYASENVGDSCHVDDVDFRRFRDLVNKDLVESCRQQMRKHMLDTRRSWDGWIKRETAGPESPVGVLDAAACGSDKSNGVEPGGGAASPPLNKRRRLGPIRCTESIDSIELFGS